MQGMQVLAQTVLHSLLAAQVHWVSAPTRGAHDSVLLCTLPAHSAPEAHQQEYRLVRMKTVNVTMAAAVVSHAN